MPISRVKSGYLLQSFVLLVSCALVVGVVGCGNGMTDEERTALKQVHSAGGRVSYRPDGWLVDFSNTDITDTELASLTHLRKLKELNVRGTRVTNPVVEDLKKQFPELKVVR